MSSNKREDFSNYLKKAEQLIYKKKFDEAREVFYHMKQLPCENAWQNVGMGSLSMELEELPSAVVYFSKALQLEPTNPDYHIYLAKTCIRLGNLDQAEKLLEETEKLRPGYADALVLKGILLVLQEKFPEACDALTVALARNANDPDVHSNLVTALIETGRFEEALHHARIAKKLDPGSAHVYYTLGTAFLKTGNMADAIKNFEKTIALEVDYAPAYQQLAAAKKFTSSDMPFIQKTERLLENSLAPIQRKQILFALGKIWDDLKEYNTAFSYYKQANTLAKPALPLDRSQIAREVTQLKRLCSRNVLESARNTGNSSQEPVFIVGMPRSGTTLLEQVIASHPLAAGAGELEIMGVISKTVAELMPKGFSSLQAIPQQLQQELTKHSNDYLAALRKGREGATRIVDKMPDNYLLLGLIAILFPNAKIIHAIRHPLDIALSCYVQPFKNIPWSNDFESIGRAYRYYRNLMKFWEKRLPANMLMDVRYEQVIASPETEFRQIIAHSGLEWDEQCLDFFQTKREVKTASVWQVRQPIYQTSKMRWTLYAEHLVGLANELREYLTDEDVAIFREKGITLKKPPLLVGGRRVSELFD